MQTKNSIRSLYQKDGRKNHMTVTSLPDDYVHYRRPRTFSVRVGKNSDLPRQTCLCR